MISAFLTFATAQTDWTAFFINFSAGYRITTFWTSWARQNWSASENLASTVISSFNHFLTFATQWSFWSVTSSWDTLKFARTATLFTGDNISDLFAFTLSAVWFFNSWTFQSLIFSRAGQTWQAFKSWVAFTLGFMKILTFFASWSFRFWN